MLLDHWATPDGGFILSDYGDGNAIGVPLPRKHIMLEEFLRLAAPGGEDTGGGVRSARVAACRRRRLARRLLKFSGFFGAYGFVRFRGFFYCQGVRGGISGVLRVGGRVAHFKLGVNRVGSKLNGFAGTAEESRSRESRSRNGRGDEGTGTAKRHGRASPPGGRGTPSGKAEEVRMRKGTEVTPSTGNVFAELGVAEPEEALAKAEVASRICALINARKLSQRKAATILGVDQPKVSALVHGRLDGFSSDRLFRFLIALDQDVEIVIKPKRPGAKRGRVEVVG